MFSFLECNVLHISNCAVLNEQHVLNSFDSVFWNYALGINFYPNLSDVLNVNKNFSLRFTDYINTVLNGGFNCQNYHRNSVAYKEMYTKMTNPSNMPIQLTSDKNYKYVLLQFPFEAFVINQKYRQLMYTKNQGKSCIGFIKPMFNEEIIKDFEKLPIVSSTIDFKEIVSQIGDVLKFPKGLYELGNLYNKTLETNSDFNKLLQQVHLSSIIKDSLKAMTLANDTSNPLANQEYIRIMYNLILFICSCYGVIVVFDK